MKTPLLVLLAAIALVVAPAAQAAIPQYTDVDLGPDFTPGAVNVHDQIVGFKPTVVASNMTTGRVWDQGHMYRPDDLVPHSSDYGPDLVDINDAGRLAGTASTGTFVGHAAWWQAGQTTPHDAGSLRSISQGVGIGASGDLLASTDDQMGGTQRMQLSPGGSAPRLVGPNDRNVVPCGLSDAGAIIAHDEDAAPGALLFYASPDATPVPLTGIVESRCGPSYIPVSHPISPAGAIVGNDPLFNDVILRDTAGVLHNLTPNRPAGTRYTPSSIVGDVIVGTRSDPGGKQVAVAWIDGEWVDLNRFAPAGISLKAATDVNANGDIVGTGSVGAIQVGFMLRAGAAPLTTQTPPPTTSPPPATPPGVYPPLPPAADPNARLLSVASVRPGGVPRVYVTRAGKTYLAGPDATFEKGDRIRTDGNTILALEFFIGGRVGVGRNTEVEIVNERGVAENRPVSLILDGGKLTVELVKDTLTLPLGQPQWDLEIQTNGGTTGIKG